MQKVGLTAFGDYFCRNLDHYRGSALSQVGLTALCKVHLTLFIYFLTSLLISFILYKIGRRTPANMMLELLIHRVMTDVNEDC